MLSSAFLFLDSAVIPADDALFFHIKASGRAANEGKLIPGGHGKAIVCAIFAMEIAVRPAGAEIVGEDPQFVSGGNVTAPNKVVVLLQNLDGAVAPSDVQRGL